MLNLISEPVAVAAIGFGGGIMLGLAARLGRFCTLGAIEDLYYGESPLRLLMWGIAIGVAIIGTFGLSAVGLLDLGQTLFLARDWNPLESIVGGAVFGYGMALAGNCGYGALARMGGGDLRSLMIVLVMGVSAYIALGGPLSGLRLWAFGETVPAATSVGFAQTTARLTGLHVHTAGIAIGAAILCATLLSKNLRAAPSHIFWGG